MIDNEKNKKFLLIASSITLLFSALFLYFEVWFLLKGFLYFVLFTVLFSFLLKYYDQYKTAIDLKKLEKWSDEHKIMLNKEKIVVESFKVEFDQSEWDLLVKKLKTSRYLEPLNEKYVPRSEYGFDPEYAKDLVDYWINDYNWKHQIEIINRYPQYLIMINSEITLHYVHYLTNSASSQQNKIVPILLLDGWPGSYFGFYKMIDYLEEHYTDYSFDILVPSIPGFGYSTPLYKPVDCVDIAEYFDALARYIYGDNQSYFIHGEDWGSLITDTMSKMYPSRVRAVHMTMPPFPTFGSMFFSLMLGSISPKLIMTQEELAINLKFSFKSFLSRFIKSTGYLHLQATKPDSLCAGLVDSPVGLLSYILEKYSLGSFDFEGKIIGTRDGNLNEYNIDDLLTVVTYYWMSNSFGSSCRLYKSHFQLQSSGWPRSAVTSYKTSERVPVAIQYFRNEVTYRVPKRALESKFMQLKRFTVMSSGGHFANFESPYLVAQDFFEFINSVI